MSFSGSVSVLPGQDVEATINEQVPPPDESDRELYDCLVHAAVLLAGDGGISGSIGGHVDPSGGHASLSLSKVAPGQPG